MVQAPYLRNKSNNLAKEQTVETSQRKQRNVSLPRRRALLAYTKKAEQTEEKRLRQYRRRRVCRLVVRGVNRLFWFVLTVVMSVIKWTGVLLQLVSKGLQRLRQVM